MSTLSGHDLGAFLRERRQAAQLSLRQLSALAGISNPYLSQIERGLKKPSAEILQGLARGLQVSAESLYVHAGFLDEALPGSGDTPGVLEAIASDPALTDRQRAVLTDVYQSFVGPSDDGIPKTTTSPSTSARTVATRSKSTTKPKEN